jgi:hypothetical protein
LKSCRAAGSWSAHSHGSDAAAGWIDNPHLGVGQAIVGNIDAGGIETPPGR